MYIFIPLTMAASLGIFKEKSNTMCFMQSLEKQPAPTVHSVDLLKEWQFVNFQTKKLRVSIVPNAAMTSPKDLKGKIENKYHYKLQTFVKPCNSVDIYQLSTMHQEPTKLSGKQRLIIKPKNLFLENPKA